MKESELNVKEINFPTEDGTEPKRLKLRRWTRFVMGITISSRSKTNTSARTFKYLTEKIRDLWLLLERSANTVSSPPFTLSSISFCKNIFVVPRGNYRQFQSTRLCVVMRMTVTSHLLTAKLCVLRYYCYFCICQYMRNFAN